MNQWHRSPRDEVAVDAKDRFFFVIFVACMVQGHFPASFLIVLADAILAELAPQVVESLAEGPASPRPKNCG